MAVNTLQPRLTVEKKAIYSGLQQAKLNGRFQLIDGDVPVLLDVAHNPQAVSMLADYLNENFSDKKIYAVFSIMKDKNADKIIDIISDNIDHWFISPLDSPRAVAEKVLHTSFSQKKLTNASFGFQNFTEAMAAAQQKAVKDDLILIFGSFLLVSEYLKAL